MKNKDLLTKQMIRQLMKAQLHDEQGDRDDITIESKTFSRILLYILMQESRITEEGNKAADTNMAAKIDVLLEEGKREFEEILDLLDKKL